MVRPQTPASAALPARSLPRSRRPPLLPHTRCFTAASPRAAVHRRSLRVRKGSLCSSKLKHRRGGRGWLMWHAPCPAAGRAGPTASTAATTPPGTWTSATSRIWQISGSTTSCWARCAQPPSPVIHTRQSGAFTGLHLTVSGSIATCYGGDCICLCCRLHIQLYNTSSENSTAWTCCSLHSNGCTAKHAGCDVFVAARRSLMSQSHRVQVSI